jgi:hypothetical protein
MIPYIPDPKACYKSSLSPAGDTICELLTPDGKGEVTSSLLKSWLTLNTTLFFALSLWIGAVVWSFT